MNQIKQMNLEMLLKLLREASVAYYETDSPIMTDSEYDALVEELVRRDPKNPYLQQVGANPRSNVVKLPVPMPSLDKKKPDTLKPNDLQNGPYILTDKLDGISALWVCSHTKKPALLLRGNGIEGQDVSHCIKGIKGLIQCSGSVRGELIVPKGVIQGTLARNWVNGILHQSNPSKEDLSKIHFVAYQVCEPRSLTRSQQITWLQTRGFEVAWFQIFLNQTIEGLSSLFQERRQESPYECDGIVVSQDTTPVQSASNPKDAFAFKMAMDDQRAKTIVKAVHWASSRTGNWIPRIQFEPVQIGTATIEYCTGFHANNIKENSIGPGAHVLIRRSGDVIPTLERVLAPSPTGWQQPPEGRWKWDTSLVHAVDTSTEASPEKLALELTHGLVSFGIEGISKTTAKKLVDGGIQTLQQILQTPVQRLQALIGKVNGEKLKNGLPTALSTATQAQWIKAYLGWPKGFGETRISATLALEPTVSKWSCLKTVPKGQSVEAFAEVLKVVPEYLEWRSQFLEVAPLKEEAQEKEEDQDQDQDQDQAQIKGHYVMSGFRDALLQKRLEDAGWILQDRISKTTTVLLIPENAKQTTKVTAALNAGIRIVKQNEVNTTMFAAA